MNHLVKRGWGIRNSIHDWPGEEPRGARRSSLPGDSCRPMTYMQMKTAQANKKLFGKGAPGSRQRS